MTSAPHQQNPSRTPISGSDSRRPSRAPSRQVGGDLHSTAGKGVPGDRMGWAGAGSIALSLFDYSGVMLEPWREAGFRTFAGGVPPPAGPQPAGPHRQP